MPDILTEKINERRKEMENKIDHILDNNDNGFSLESDHNYTALPINPHALTVLAGYVARKMRKIKLAKTYDKCYIALCATENDKSNDDIEKLMNIKSYDGYLLVPSKELYEIISQVSN